jgi:tRNA pseudouridine32 synthase / 23S rRNA pseudouridine746 synthase
MTRIPVDRHSVVNCPRGNFATLLDFLCAKFDHVSRDRWLQRFAAQEIRSEAETVLTPEQAYSALVGKKISYLRTLEFEAQIPFYASTVFEDELIVVLDKPHFLPVIPAGRHFGETLLIRARREFNLPELTPAHRIDQDTAGLVLLIKQTAHRGAYQNLFLHHRIEKTYQAIARHNPNVQLPLRYRSRLENAEHFMQMREVEGEANAETWIERIAANSEWAHLRLQPKSGKRHQLRAQLSALGMPIQNDRIYPTLAAKDAPISYDEPLKLLASSQRFMDPISGVERFFQSTRTLEL